MFIGPFEGKPFLGSFLFPPVLIVFWKLQHVQVVVADNAYRFLVAQSLDDLVREGTVADPIADVPNLIDTFVPSICQDSLQGG